LTVGAGQINTNTEGGSLAPIARHYLWRAGRKLYMWARKDQPNEMATNGEALLQRLLLDQTARSVRFVAFDVGARVGDWSKSLIDAASRRPGGLEIHAFEPVPDSRRALADANKPQIDDGTLRVNSVALSDDSRRLPFYVPHVMAGTSTLHPDTSVSYQSVFEVETTTAADYCRVNSIDRIDLMKVDTEGNDLKVIRGALPLLRDARIGVLQFEYNHRWIYSRCYLKDVFDLLRNTPYRVAKVCSDGLEAYADWHPELERYFETNYALVHEALTAKLKCRLLRIGRGNACERVV
jgi:FkbM family methyltransferase